MWHGACTANISFASSGQLGYDITSGNILSFQNAIGNCSDATQPVNAVVYDLNGSIMTALGPTIIPSWAFRGHLHRRCSRNFTRGWTVLNGRFIDGQPDSSSHASVSLEVFKTVLVHEFGHLIGLDHSQVNLNCYTDASCSSEEMAGCLCSPCCWTIRTNTLKTDDVAAISARDPASDFGATTGRIQGNVLFSDG